MKRVVCTLLSVLFVSFSFATDSTTIRVYFLYGSKPKKEYKNIERNWFGGKLGGHVGIELDHDKILNFLPKGKLHITCNNKNPHGSFYTHTENDFWNILGYVKDSVKSVFLEIPVSANQKQRLDSIAFAYQKKVPYDYAFFGMRCASSTYEILAQLGVVKRWHRGKTWRRIFYPRRLRKRLLKLAEQNSWVYEMKQGNTRRDWEKD